MQSPMQEQAQNLIKHREKTTAHVGLRLPPSIAQHWKTAARAQGKTLSDWLRLQVHDLEIRMEETKKKPRGKREIIRTYQNVDPVLIRELGRIGNNLNQIARQVNSAAMMGQTVQVISFLMVLIDMQNEIRATLQTVSNEKSMNNVTTQHEEKGNAD